MVIIDPNFHRKEVARAKRREWIKLGIYIALCCLPFLVLHLVW